jgi:hypothetical protein
VKRILKKARSRLQRPEPESPAAAQAQVTEQTIEKHRKEIFSKGRRFVYPIHLTKRHIVRNSILVSILVITVFFGSVALSIYRYKSDSDIIYRISKVIPFPVASVNGRWVSYKDYLFILRSNRTYLEGQGSQRELASPEVLAQLRQDALAEAKRNALLKQLARERGIEVSDQEVRAQIALLESFASGERRLGDIVREFYGIDLSDLRGLLYIQLLQQKLTPAVSDKARAEIEELRQRALGGEDFAALAREYSHDEQTASGGGALGTLSTDSTEIEEPILRAGLALEVGAISEIIETEAGFHVVKKLSRASKNSAELAHILINYDDIDAFLEERLRTATVKDFVRL